MNVEVFKTNVGDPEQARLLIDQIQQSFTGYIVNFDLEDCDKILRVKCATELIQSAPLIKLLNDFGFEAEVL
ncbi:MAG TPA: hypothetical protein VIU45_04635 [Chitinophagaceae bacterium]